MKVEQYNALNQFHLYGEGKDYLQSYNSLVVKIENSIITLGRHWDYSRTTSKYVYMFLYEYGCISFLGITDKRKYVNNLIKEGKIIYDEDMV